MRFCWPFVGLLIPACASAGEQRTRFEVQCQRPARHLTGMAAELDYVGHFVRAFEYRCRSGEVLVTRSEDSNVVIETDPPIRESVWKLSGCGDEMTIKLDCSPRDDVGVECRAHDWPPLVRSNWTTEPAEQLTASAEAARRLPCADQPYFTLRLIPAEAIGYRRNILVDRCGKTYHSKAACTMQGTTPSCTAQLSVE